MTHPQHQNRHLRSVTQPSFGPSPLDQARAATATAMGQAEQARDGGSANTARPQALQGLGADEPSADSSDTTGQVTETQPQPPVTDQYGSVPMFMPNALATLRVGAGGAIIGGLSAWSWRGSIIGATTSIALFGLSAALLGGDRLPTSYRIGYAVLMLACAGAAGYAIWTRK